MDTVHSKRAQNSLKLSVFGLEQFSDLKVLRTSLEHINGIKTAKLDLKKNIAHLTWRSDSCLTKEQVILAVFQCGIAAEELTQ
jgi:hypothetical protein